MAAVIPAQVADTGLTLSIERAGLPLVSKGKVRHTFGVPGYPGFLLQVATDRVSIYDFVLAAQVPHKGAILTAMTVFWLTKVLGAYNHHLVAFGSGIDEYLPKTLRGNRELQTLALVIEKLSMQPVECVVRGYLTGSGWASYQRDGEVCGIPLPEGLHDGSKLPSPIFTPTTKAETGHDTNLPTDQVRKEYPGIEELSIEIYSKGAEYTEGQGIALADTKFELGIALQGELRYVLGDEVLTPDSSRFWDAREWQEASSQKKSPTPYDKQVVRDWGRREWRINQLDPERPEDVEFVHGLTVPDTILAETTARYHTIFERLVETTLQDFQRDAMGVV